MEISSFFPLPDDTSLYNLKRIITRQIHAILLYFFKIVSIILYLKILAKLLSNCMKRLMEIPVLKILCILGTTYRKSRTTQFSS